MKCMYCGAVQSEMFVVRQATKPKHSPYRWQRIGHCCDVCDAASRPLILEYTPNALNINATSASTTKETAMHREG